MQKITPCLWFKDNAQEALDFYLSVFKDAKVISKTYYDDGKLLPSGPLLVAYIEVLGFELVLLNAGNTHQFNPSVSLTINCNDQAEVDYYWEKLGNGGEIDMCGWLRDKFGLSWQITPIMLPKLIAHPDMEIANRAMQAMMQMKKIDIATLEAAVK